MKPDELDTFLADIFIDSGEEVSTAAGMLRALREGTDLDVLPSEVDASLERLADRDFLVRENGGYRLHPKLNAEMEREFKEDVAEVLAEMVVKRAAKK